VQVIIGGYTAEMGGSASGVRSLVVDLDEDGAVHLDESANLALASPSFLIAHPEQPWLFAVTEGTPSLVHSLALAADGGLERLASRESGGEVGAHLALSPDNRYVVVAHYGSGSVSSFAVDDRGRLSERLDLMTFDGSGPVPERQDGSRAHQVVFTGGELLVSDLGTDRVHRLVLGADGRFRTGADPIVLPAGSGPRHLVVIEDFLVVACELSADLWLGRRTDDGWAEAQRVPASTWEVDEPIAPSALRADGNHVFLANRGAGTIAVFDLDQPSGRLIRLTEFPGGGACPRDLVVHPDGLWVANQTNQVISVFSRSALPPARALFEFASPSPACIVLGTR
jgi:6-phosphogluconolactonase